MYTLKVINVLFISYLHWIFFSARINNSSFFQLCIVILVIYIRIIWCFVFHTTRTRYYLSWGGGWRSLKLYNTGIPYSWYYGSRYCIRQPLPFVRVTSIGMLLEVCVLCVFGCFLQCQKVVSKIVIDISILYFIR